MADLHAPCAVALEVDLLEHCSPRSPVRDVADDVQVRLGFISLPPHPVDGARRMHPQVKCGVATAKLHPRLQHDLQLFVIGDLDEAHELVIDFIGFQGL